MSDEVSVTDGEDSEEEPAAYGNVQDPEAEESGGASHPLWEPAS